MCSPSVRPSVCLSTGVNPARDARDISPTFWLGGRQREYPPKLLRTFGYSRPILVALCSFSLKPISFGYKTPPIRFSQAGGQSAQKARRPNLELALTPLCLSHATSSKPCVGSRTHWSQRGSVGWDISFWRHRGDILFRWTCDATLQNGG